MDHENWYDVSTLLAQMQLHFLFESTRACVAAGDVRGIIELWQSIGTATKKRVYEMSTTYEETARDQSGHEHEALWTALQTNVYRATLPVASATAGRAAAEAGRTSGAGIPPEAACPAHTRSSYRRHDHKHLQHQNGEPHRRYRKAKRTDLQDVGYSGWKPGSCR